MDDDEEWSEDEIGDLFAEYAISQMPQEMRDALLRLSARPDLPFVDIMPRTGDEPRMRYWGRNEVRPDGTELDPFDRCLVT